MERDAVFNMLESYFHNYNNENEYARLNKEFTPLIKKR
jgi:hypothetical protein